MEEKRARIIKEKKKRIIEEGSALFLSNVSFACEEIPRGHHGRSLPCDIRCFFTSSK